MSVSGKVVQLLTPAQKELVSSALVLVERRAKANARRFAGLVDPEELETDGKIALLEMVQRYDARHDGTFEGYAVKCIDGRMLDLIRCESFKKRIDREVQTAYLMVWGYREEYSLPQETDQTLEARLERFCKLIVDVGFMGGAQQVSLEEDTAERREHVHVMEGLAAAVAQLSEKERDVLGAMLVDGLTLEDAAAFLGVSRSTAWRLLERARECVKRELLRRGVRRVPLPCDVEGMGPVLRGVGAKPGERQGRKPRKP